MAVVPTHQAAPSTTVPTPRRVSAARPASRQRLTGTLRMLTATFHRAVTALDRPPRRSTPESPYLTERYLR